MLTSVTTINTIVVVVLVGFQKETLRKRRVHALFWR